MKRGTMTIEKARGRWAAPALLASLALAPDHVFAGPPFRTDDPGIVERGHFEILPFYSQTLAAGGRSGALPGLEIHYGALDNFEVDLVVQAAFNTPPGATTQRGFGDTEIALKYQFIQESETRPAIGFVPNFIFPTGNADRGLGNGGGQIFLPVWLQKSSGKYTTYGGGGYLLNNGAGNRNDWFFGWVVLYQFSEQWTLGGEIFHSTPQTVAQGASTGFTLGGIYQIDSHSQLLFSAGKGLQDAAQTNRVSTYVGCLLSF
jgi:hypothetical protein